MVANSTNLLKLIKLYTYNEWILRYVTYISIKRKRSHQFNPLLQKESGFC